MKIVLIICLLLPALARAGSVTLEWNANPENDVDHYTLTYGDYGQLEDQAVSVPAAAINSDGDSYQVTLSLPDGKLYEATVVAINASGVSSLPSNLLTFVTDGTGAVPAPVALPSSFFAGARYLSNGVWNLSFPSGNSFGYYSYLSDPRYIYHFDLGYEYVFDAKDGRAGVYFYDFESSTFFYTSPAVPFPFLYDFGLNAILYYYPDPSNAGRYTTSPRSFYDFATGQIITK